MKFVFPSESAIKISPFPALCFCHSNLEGFDYDSLGCFNDDNGDRVLTGPRIDHDELTTEVSSVIKSIEQNKLHIHYKTIIRAKYI